MDNELKKKSFFRPTLIVSGLTFLSRGLGLLRDVLISNVLGVSYITDIFIIALRIPNLFRRLTAEGAFSTVFIPMFSKKLLIHRKIALNFAEDIFFISLILMIIITSILQILMPLLIYFIAYGFIDDPVKYNLAINYSRITVPYILLISLSSLGIGILNSLGRYFASSFLPILFNITLILVLILPVKNSILIGYLLSFGVIFSGIIQLLLIFYFLYKAGYSLNFKKPKNLKSIIKFSEIAKPQLITGFVMQANIIFSGIIASFVEGGISILYYAERLYQLPLALFGISIGTVLLPTLSNLDIKKDINKINPVISNTIKFALIMIIPSAVGLSIISAPIISVIYEHGMFSELNTLNVSKVLIAFSTGLPAFVLIKIYLPIFYSLGDTKTPLFYSLISIALNLILAILLFNFLGVVGIALSTSISSWINFVLLVLGSEKYKIKISSKRLKMDLFKIILSTAFMALYVIILSKFLIQISLFLKLMILVISGASIYFLTLFILGVFNKNDIIDIIQS